MPLSQSPLIETKRTRKKGRGVFAKEFIPAGTEIERVPLLVMDSDTIDESILMDYVYTWTEKTVALALGYGSLYNHSFKPNAIYEDIDPRMKRFVAHRDIQPGEEITINYNAEPDCLDDVGFSVTD